MKKFTMSCLALVLAGSAWAQRPGRVADHQQMTKSEDYSSRLEQINRAEMLPLGRNVGYAPETPAQIGQRTAAVNPIAIGRASNVYSILRPEQNQVIAVDSLGLVGFIHRQDVTIFGGGGAESGKLRYDFSTDKGATFTNDIGALNATYTRPSRYPNMSAFNNSGTNNPFDAMMVYSAPTLNPSPDWDGHVTGVSDITAAAPTVTENYALLSQQSYLQGGLTQGLPGEFWSVDWRYDGAGFTGELFLNKGTYNAGTGDIDWVRQDTINPPHYTGFDGTATVIGPNIAFSPDGMTGWIAWLGDLQGGSDTTVNPVFVKSTDGGATWGTPVEYDLNTEPWVADTIRSLWVDSLGNPVATGRATCAFDYDLTVDGNGNAHMAVVIGPATSTASPDPGYTIFSGLAKFMADIWTPDGGATWMPAYISPVLAFRGDFGTGDPVSMDNMPQISRTPNGDHVFYSWVDTDTAQYTGNMTGVGLGESTQLAPNLRIAAKRISDGYQTYPQLVTDGDLIWEGRILYPTMAPEVLIDNGMIHLPIVAVEMLSNDPLQPCQFHYFGNDAVIDAAPSNFCDPATMTLGWNQFGFAGANTVCAVGVEADDFASNVVLHQSYPNPTTNQAVIGFELPTAADINLDVVNIYGQTVATLAAGEHNAGLHKVNVETSNLAAGVYFYNLRVAGKTFTKKMIVTK